MRSAVANMWLCLGAFALAGCVSLDGYETDADTHFVGQIYGADDDCMGATSCSFIRRGFAAETVLELDFFPEQTQTAPGRISTTGEPCMPAFDDVPLEPIVPLAHDALSLYEIPGGGRLRNYIFAAHPITGPLAGRDVMVFVSLLSWGGVEVRIVAGSGSAQCDPNACGVIDAGGCDYYGLFVLRLRDTPP